MPRGAGETPHFMGGLSCPPSDACIEQVPMTGAQLTIFYSGMVNVYDDVPADKAHAIMLLLKNGDGGTSSGLGQANTRPSTTSDMDDSTTAGRASVGERGDQPVQPLNRSSTPPPSYVSIFTQAQKKQQGVVKRSQAELPFARKASLARFLEKRKDRVQAKPGAASEEEEVPRGPSKKIK